MSNLPDTEVMLSRVLSGTTKTIWAQEWNKLSEQAQSLQNFHYLAYLLLGMKGDDDTPHILTQADIEEKMWESYEHFNKLSLEHHALGVCQFGENGMIGKFETHVRPNDPLGTVKEVDPDDLP